MKIIEISILCLPVATVKLMVWCGLDSTLSICLSMKCAHTCLLTVLKWLGLADWQSNASVNFSRSYEIYQDILCSPCKFPTFVFLFKTKKGSTGPSFSPEWCLAAKTYPLKNKINTHDWNNDKPYEGDLQTLNGKQVFECTFLMCWYI